MAKPPKGPKTDYMPSREQIMEFLRENPGKVGKREISRAFGIKGDDRIILKALLKEMKDDGMLGGRRSDLAIPGELPSVTVIDIYDRDRDGEFLCRPKDWDEKENGPAPKIFLAPFKPSRGMPGAGLNDRVLARLTRLKGEKLAYEAKVIRILEKDRGKRLAIFEEEKGGGRLIPIDKKGGDVYHIDARDIGAARHGDLVAYDVRRQSHNRLHRAFVTEVVGNLHQEKAVSLIALYSHDIPFEFSKATLWEAEKAKPVSAKGREDLTHIPFVTIDPPDAKDHDDAVFAEPREKGGHIVWVAIADVSAYVTSGSSMDKEAEDRGNSVYFPDRVVPMLPERISNDLCSLRENEPRPSLVMRMVFDASGRKVSQTIHRAIIRSRAKLAYTHAQALINGEADDRPDVLEESLKPVWAAYETLKKGRDAREPLELDLPERKILLKPDGTVDRVVVPERLDAHKLIEEFMIQANVAAAELLEAKKAPVVYRVHDAPAMAKMESLREFLKSIDVSAPQGENLTPASFNHILRQVVGHSSEQLTNEVILRSQSQAVYSPDNLGHFGLNLRRYAHFTSPIRRYADLLVHRSLIRAYELGDDGILDHDVERLEAISGHISNMERRAMAAERDTIDRLIADFLADQVGATFEGRISGVVSSGMFVRLNDTGADGFVPAATLGKDYYVFDEAHRALIGARTGETFRLGDDVTVKLVEAAPISGGLRFEVLSEGRKGPLPSGHRSRKSQPGGGFSKPPGRKSKPKGQRRS